MNRVGARLEEWSGPGRAGCKMAPDVKFMKNRLGGVALVIDNCRYRINRRAGKTVYWRCFFRWCRANAVVESGKLKSSCGVHICSQPLKGRYQPAERRRVAAAASSSASAPTSSATVAVPVAVPASGPATATAKMATRAAQLPKNSVASSSSSASCNAKPALARLKKSTTNNNMVVRRKGKTPDNKRTGDQLPNNQRAPVVDSAQPVPANVKVEETNQQSNSKSVIFI